MKTADVKILLVDDEPDILEIVGYNLKSEGYKVYTASSGREGVEKAKEFLPDLILLDVMMPTVDGFEVCRRLKADIKTQHIAIIFITALDQTQQVVKGLELGAVDYVTNPIEPSVLKARIKTQSSVIRGQKQMRNQLDTLMEMAQLKEEFDRIAQNDLKRPLEEISECLNLLTRNIRDPSRVKQSTITIKSNVSQMAQMVDNMLTLGKIEEGTYQLKPVTLDVSRLVRDVIKAFATSFTRKKLEIQNENLEKVLIDGEELLTISLLSNLLKNAIEAAPRGSAINISEEKEGTFHTISICNTGSVPEEIQGVFFNKYVTSGKKNGTGIGTYAAKVMTEIQHGKISFSCQGNESTTLKVSLPAAFDRS